MENFKPIPQNTKESQTSLSQIKSAFDNLDFTRAELIDLFNAKYKDVEFLQLITQNGEPYRDKEDKLSPLLDPNKISDDDKYNHIYGSLIKKFESNQVDYVDRLSKETELLDLIEKKGVKIRSLIEEYQK